MNRLIRTELLKQRTLRVFVFGVCLAPIVAALVTIAVLAGAGHQDNPPLGSASLVLAMGAPASAITLVALLLGVLGTAGEHRHQTITTTFLATPRRRQVIQSKLLSHAFTGALMGALALAASLAISVPWLLANEIDITFDARLARVAAGIVASTALHGALGVSVGALVRNQTAACATVLIWVLAVEGLIGDIFNGWGFLQWLPVAAAQSIVRSDSSDGLPVALGIVVFATYSALFGLAATRTTLQRDVT